MLLSILDVSVHFRHFSRRPISNHFWPATLDVHASKPKRIYDRFKGSFFCKKSISMELLRCTLKKFMTHLFSPLSLALTLLAVFLISAIKSSSSCFISVNKKKVIIAGQKQTRKMTYFRLFAVLTKWHYVCA